MFIKDLPVIPRLLERSYAYKFPCVTVAIVWCLFKTTSCLVMSQACALPSVVWTLLASCMMRQQPFSLVGEECLLKDEHCGIPSTSVVGSFWLSCCLPPPLNHSIHMSEKLAHENCFLFLLFTIKVLHSCTLVTWYVTIVVISVWYQISFFLTH